MDKPKSFFLILIPSATVFFSSACIMVLELLAGRMVARHFGSSLYTWTSVIGVVLAGITIGNYLGGRIADRMDARKTLSVLFAISSVACVATIVLNNLVPKWMLLWYFHWPLRVFSHVFLVFMIPSILLGTISPVVAKTALDRGLPMGRTIGDIYAWGAAGSIAGTFLTGFYLIAAMGTIAVIWTIGVALLFMAILYWVKLKLLYIWAAVFFALMTMGIAPGDWAKNSGAYLSLREESNPNILYKSESQYNYIAVVQLSANPDKRKFMQDKLTHSIITMNDMTDLEYTYDQIYAAVTHRLSQAKNELSVLAIGGGGYVFPRYIEKVWPGSRIDVVEIDPEVTEAAIQAFGLQRDAAINTFTMDARNYVDQLLWRMRSGAEVPRYDFIYGDAFSDYSVPYQLVTKEFNNKIAQVLKDDGVYMLNLIDTYLSGQFLGSIINTLEHTFFDVQVLSKVMPHSSRSTYVVIASKQEINIDGLINQFSNDIDIWYLNHAEISMLKQKSSGIVLTDDYVPTEKMLAPVVRQSTVAFLSSMYVETAEILGRLDKFDEAIATYKELIEFDRTKSVSVYSKIAQMMEKQGKIGEASEVLQDAIRYNEEAENRANVAEVHLNLGLLLKVLERPGEARGHFQKAIEGFRRKLVKNPNAIRAIIGLGASLEEVGQAGESTKYLQQAVNIDPYDVDKHLMLAKSLTIQKRYDDAIKRLRKGIEFMLDGSRKDDASKLNEFLRSVEVEKKENNR
ncbi:MAG: fused MFS/spermidine synthase [Planctomycetota bacterium]